MYNFTVVSWLVLGILTVLITIIYFIIENFTQVSVDYHAWGDNFNLKWWLVILINSGAVLAYRVAYNTVRFNLYPTLVQKWMIKRNREYILKHKIKPVIELETLPPLTQ
jgi:uncharacterized integral membrane protein